MRHRRKKWQEEESNTNQYIIRQQGKLNTIFENDNDLHIEIGCGKGNFIIQVAEANPDRNYIAIEIEDEIIAFASRNYRLHLEGTGSETGNVYFLNEDAKTLLYRFDEHSISRIYLNFSDPWRNRKKWQKRIITHVNFLEIYKKLLVENGEIHFKTDNQKLFEFSLEQFSQANFLLKNITLNLHAVAEQMFEDGIIEKNYVTEYEQKFSEQGMPIYRLEAVKR